MSTDSEPRPWEAWKKDPSGFLWITWHDYLDFVHHEDRRVERWRAAVQVSDFRCIRPFGLRGKWPPDHQHVSSSLSKIPYSGFSPVRLQTGFQPRPSSNLPSLSARPAFPRTPWIYTRLQSLSPGRANCFRPRTCVQSELSCPDGDHPVQRSLAPLRVMLSRWIIAYYYLMRASRPLPPVYGLSSGSLPYGLVWAGNEKVPNLSCSSISIVPSSVPRRPGDCSWLLLHRPLWPSPPSQKIGVRTLTLAGSSRESCYHEAAKFTLCYGPTELLAPLRLGRLLSSFHLLGHPWGVSSIATRAYNQFPWPDFHRLDKQPYRLRTKSTKSKSISIRTLRVLRALRGESYFG